MPRKPIPAGVKPATEYMRRWREKERKKQLLAGKRDKPALRPPRKSDDVGQDLWSTPPCLIAALIQFILPELPPGLIWECAAGMGALADALRGAGREVFASDIERWRPDITRLDYLLHSPPAATLGAILITNPPFSQLDAFLARTFELLDAGHLTAAVLLVRHDFPGQDGRAEPFNRAWSEWECNWRSRWIPGSTGNPRWWCQWTAFQAGRSGPPVHIRLRRRQLAA